MRGRGRGGRGGRGRGYEDSGIPRIGPVTEESAAYPYNPSLTKTQPSLEDEQQCLVALNRILDATEMQSVRTYTAGLHQAGLANPKAQKEQIIAFAGARFFPKELLLDTYTPPRTRRVIKPRRVNLSATADGEKEGQDGQQDDDLEEQAVEDDDFGGDDYAHNHYADEDKDDDDGGGDDDVI